MGKIVTKQFIADGNAYNLELGFTPSYVAVYNAMAVAGEVFKAEWFGSEMGDSYMIKHTVLADNGSTGNLSMDYVTTGGPVSAYNSKVVGLRKSVTFDDTGGASEDLITCTEAGGHGLSTGEKVRFVESGGLPTNLTETTDYYVIDATATTFRVSTTKGGTAVDFGSDGTAPNYVYSLDNLVTVGYKGVTIAAAFMDDSDIMFVMAIESDRDTNIGDIA